MFSITLCESQLFVGGPSRVQTCLWGIRPPHPVNDAPMDGRQSNVFGVALLEYHGPDGALDDQERRETFLH